MEELIKIDKNKKILYFALMLFFTVVMLVTMFFITAIGKLEGNDIEIDSGWEVQINGKTYKNVTLSEFKFDMCNRGDIVLMTHDIPAYDSISQPSLVLYSVHSTVRVLVDDTVIYQFGLERYDEQKMLGYGRHFVTFPHDAEGKKLTIELQVSENNAFDGIQPINITDGNTFIARDLGSKKINLATAMFLLIFGIIIMLLSMVMVSRSLNFVQTFCIAMFSFLMGCWTLCNSDLIEYMSDDLLVKSYLEYMSLYMIPLPFTYYFRDRIEGEDKPKWMKIYFWILIGLELVFVIVAGALQAANIAHLPYVLSGVHAIMLLAIVFFILLSIYEMKHNKQRINSVMIGFIIAIILVLFEIIRFNLNKYFIGFEKNEYSSITCFAVLIIVISMLVDYGNRISKVLYDNAKKAVLEQMAYTDELTGLGNRRCFDEKLKEIGKNNYAIVSFDLNYLKRTNDTYGHDKGDELIKDFADILKETFVAKGVTVRTGGDEFVVILEDTTRDELEKYLGSMNERLDRKNKERTEIKISTSYGYAISDENFQEEGAKTDPRFIYRIADDRMYECKRQSCHGRGNGAGTS